jgi:hypothetical protein
MPTDTTHPETMPTHIAPPDTALDAALALLRAELGADVVYDGPGRACPSCTEQDDRVAA